MQPQKKPISFIAVTNPNQRPAPVAKVSRPKMPKVPMGVVDQVRESMKPKNRLATALGFLLGGIVPVMSYVVAHHQIDTAGKSIFLQLGTYLVLGGLLYSAKTVYGWGKRAFASPTKAVGFVLLVEGIMVLSTSTWLSIVALGYLVAINGIATGCTLSVREIEIDK